MLAEEEYRRLLYVGMTRAADRLVVCGYRGVRANTDTWHAMISAAMRDSHPHVSAATFSGPDGEWQRNQMARAAGRSIGVSNAPDRAEPARQRDAAASTSVSHCRRNGSCRARSALPAPGTIIDEDADDLLVVSPLFARRSEKRSLAAERRLLHRMLQMLPDIPPAERAGAAGVMPSGQLVSGRWPNAKLVDSVLKLLTEPELQPVLAAHAQAEVSIMGTLTLGGRAMPSPAASTGWRPSDRVVILDYKTNRVPPQTWRHSVRASGAAGDLPRDPGAALSRQAHRLCAGLYRERLRLHAGAGSAGIGACAAQDKVKYRTLKFRHRTLTCGSTGNP
jgi:ATP-dependent helicase/nuclease subunit A